MQSAKAEGFDAKKRTLQLVRQVAFAASTCRMFISSANEQVMKNFKPVFHYFFLEMFCDPETWYAAVWCCMCPPHHKQIMAGTSAKPYMHEVLPHPAWPATLWALETATHKT